MRQRSIVRALSVGASVLALAAPAATASASTTADRSVKVNSIEANLRGPDLTRWKNLTKGQKIATARILSDPAYGIPARAPGLTKKRSIDSNSWSTLGNGLADCWTEWTLSRPLQSTVTGYQGLRVNGYGTILKVWYV